VVREGLAVIIVEQDVALAQGMSRRLYCFQEGRVSLRGASSAITRAEITRAYFGV
jgi:branched-chain amino acid transport system ATP-binding protein